MIDVGWNYNSKWFWVNCFQKIKGIFFGNNSPKLNSSQKDKPLHTNLWVISGAGLE